MSIQATQLGKKYRIDKSKSLREDHEEFWALRDVTLSVSEGESVGIIGANGSGKSTFLKLLSRVTRPSSGQLVISGRVGALLEVGIGFHGDLTGRENIYLSGAILGMRQKEVKRYFDEIIAFSGVEEFLDTPVKKYSSGMFLRLAFSVMAHLKSEIFIVDEIFSVGDQSFYQKCKEKMRSIASEGRTIIVVSHQSEVLEALCTRILWLEQGRLIADGEPQFILQNCNQCKTALHAPLHKS